MRFIARRCQPMDWMGRRFFAFILTEFGRDADKLELDTGVRA